MLDSLKLVQNTRNFSRLEPPILGTGLPSTRLDERIISSLLVVARDCFVWATDST